MYGLGALGSYIVEGVAQSDDAKLFGGVILVALLALLAEGGLALDAASADLAGPAVYDPLI